MELGRGQLQLEGYVELGRGQLIDRHYDFTDNVIVWRPT